MTPAATMPQAAISIVAFNFIFRINASKKDDPEAILEVGVRFYYVFNVLLQLKHILWNDRNDRSHHRQDR